MNNLSFIPQPSSLIIKVEMGEGIVAKAPHILKSEGCGSCVILTLYDAIRKTGSLAHIMFPVKYKDKGERMKDKISLNSSFIPQPSSFEYADTALPALFEEMKGLGCQKQNIVAKIAGGARMFPSYAEATSIGEQNIRSVMRSLEAQGIPLKGRDTGGSHGRSVEFHLETGRVVVKAFEKEDREI